MASTPAPAAPQQGADGGDADSQFQYMSPPQAAGSPQRLYTEGAPADEEKVNIALKVLRDPVARNSFSRIYSGQRRGWNR